MDGLRLALLLIGIVIVVAIYFNSRRKQSADIRNSLAQARIEPDFEVGDDVPITVDPDPTPPAVAPPIDDAVEQVPPTPDLDFVDSTFDDEEPAADVPEKVISLRIVRKDGGEFPAEDVILNLRGVGLQHGRFGIFHRMHDEDVEEAVFSVASLTEPGSFDLQDLREKTLAGLSFFMVRPGPGRGVEAFDKMVEIARAIATSLQGELLDGSGSTMSIQRERFMREDLIQYELKHLQL